MQYLEEALEAAEATYDSGDELEGGEGESSEEGESTGEGESSSEGESTEEEEQWEEAERGMEKGEEGGEGGRGGGAASRQEGSDGAVSTEQLLNELRVREEAQHGGNEPHPGVAQQGSRGTALGAGEPPLEAQDTNGGPPPHQSAQRDSPGHTSGPSESGSEEEAGEGRLHAPGVDRRSLKKERARAVSSVKPGGVNAKLSRNATKDKSGKRSRHIRSTAKGDY